MIQLWVNLPKKDKMTDPAYQAIENKDMGKLVLENNQGTVTVVAGEYNGVKGPAKTHTPMNIYVIDLNKNGRVILNEPDNFNFGMLLLSGTVNVNEEAHETNDFILFKNEDGSVNIEATSEDVKLFVLSGEPINEPIAAGGPFVMNTKEELRQANEDFYNGDFGTSDF